MASGYRDLYFIERQANQSFLNVKTDDFGIQISTGNLNSFIMGSSGNFINSGLANSLIFGQGPNRIASSSALILDSARSIVTGGGGGAIIGGGSNGIGSSGAIGLTSDRFNLIAGGCRNTINTAGAKNIILGGGINRLGLGSELYLNPDGSRATPSATLSPLVLNDNAIMGGNHNEINGAQRSIILGGYYNCMGQSRAPTNPNEVISSNILNGLCNGVFDSSYSTILNGVANIIDGPANPQLTVTTQDANPYNNAILNGSYAYVVGSGITVINDGRFRGLNEIGRSAQQRYGSSRTIYLDATSGVNIVTGNLILNSSTRINPTEEDLSLNITGTIV
jgi:hypothetical protein